jgi:hypothetical protein
VLHWLWGKNMCILKIIGCHARFTPTLLWTGINPLARRKIKDGASTKREREKDRYK